MPFAQVNKKVSRRPPVKGGLAQNNREVDYSVTAGGTVGGTSEGAAEPSATAGTPAGASTGAAVPTVSLDELPIKSQPASTSTTMTTTVITRPFFDFCGATVGSIFVMLTRTLIKTYFLASTMVFSTLGGTTS